MRAIRLDANLTSYIDVLQLQQRVARLVRQLGQPGALLPCEHEPTYVLGRSGSCKHIRAGSAASLAEDTGAKVHTGDRGGEITFHGPGQAVVYPIVDLKHVRIGPRAFVHALEDAMVHVCAKHGVHASARDEAQPGAWVHDQVGSNDRKIGAVGVRVKEGMTSHGLAFNVAPDLRYFDHIVPCGIDDRGVTSLANEQPQHEPVPAVQTIASQMMHSLLPFLGLSDAAVEHVDVQNTHQLDDATLLTLLSQ